MKKQLFLLATGAIALTACTSEEVLDDLSTSSRNAIQFENVINKMTRVTDLNTSNFKQFNVFGFYTVPNQENLENQENHANQVFYNVPVTNDGSGKWTYADTDTRYWIPNANYYFYAYSCGSTKLGEGKFGDYQMNMSNEPNSEGEIIPPSERVLEIDDYLCDYTHQHDLIVASNTGKNFEGLKGQESGYNSDVTLEFKHILTKIKARFTSQFSPEYTVVIKNVSVRNIYNYGDYHFTKGWSGVNKKDEEAPLVYLLNTNGDGPDGMSPAEKQKITDAAISVQNKKVTINETEVQESVETNTAYVIPFDYENKYGGVYINLDIDLMFGTDLVMSKTLSATFFPHWQAGYSYVYNIELSAKDLELGTIGFTTSVANWNTDNVKEETIGIDKKTNP